MKRYAPSVGWNHPAFAEPGGSSCPEPWHWEWVGDGGDLHLSPVRGDAVALLPGADDRGYGVVERARRRDVARQRSTATARPRRRRSEVGDGRRDDHAGPQRLLDGRRRRRRSSASATRKFYGSTRRQAAQRADQRHGADALRQRATGCVAWDGGDLQLRRRQVPRLDRRDAPEQAGRRHGAPRRAATATGSSRPTAAIFSFGDATFRGSTGAIRLNSPIVGMAPTRDGSRLLAGRVRRRRVHVRRRAVLRFAGRAGHRVARRSESCRRRRARATGSRSPTERSARSATPARSRRSRARIAPGCRPLSRSPLHAPNHCGFRGSSQRGVCVIPQTLGRGALVFRQAGVNDSFGLSEGDAGHGSDRPHRVDR